MVYQGTAHTCNIEWSEVEPCQGHCTVFLGKTLDSYCLLQPGEYKWVQVNTMLWGDSSVDWRPIQGTLEILLLQSLNATTVWTTDLTQTLLLPSYQ